MTHDDTIIDTRAASERATLCDAYCAFVETRAKLQAEYDTMRAARKAGGK